MPAPRKRKGTKRKRPSTPTYTGPPLTERLSPEVLEQVFDCLSQRDLLAPLCLCKSLSAIVQRSIVKHITLYSPLGACRLARLLSQNHFLRANVRSVTMFECPRPQLAGTQAVYWPIPFDSVCCLQAGAGFQSAISILDYAHLQSTVLSLELTPFPTWMHGTLLEILARLSNLRRLSMRNPTSLPATGLPLSPFTGCQVLDLIESLPLTELALSGVHGWRTPNANNFPSSLAVMELEDCSELLTDRFLLTLKTLTVFCAKMIKPSDSVGFHWIDGLKEIDLISDSLLRKVEISVAFQNSNIESSSFSLVKTSWPPEQHGAWFSLGLRGLCATVEHVRPYINNIISLRVEESETSLVELLGLLLTEAATTELQSLYVDCAEPQMTTDVQAFEHAMDFLRPNTSVQVGGTRI